MLKINVYYGEKPKEFRNVNHRRLKPLEMHKKRKKPKTVNYPLPLSPCTRGGAYKLTGKLVVFDVCRQGGVFTFRIKNNLIIQGLFLVTGYIDFNLFL